MKKNFGLSKIEFVLINTGTFFLASAVEVLGQVNKAPLPVVDDPEDYTWWYILLSVLVIGLVGAIIWLLKTKKEEKERVAREEKAKQKREGSEAGSLDAYKELEWLRKNQNLVDKKRKKKTAKKKIGMELSDSNGGEMPDGAGNGENDQSDVFLPVFNFKKLEPAKQFSPLPLSNDEALLSAVEQTHDEYEEDEEVRELSVRILTAFKTRNSVEALSQVALYDLSSSLRSKAVLTLTEFDHESVFETILLACADPTREVRAAAARGLTRLSFDRADAWARIAETGEEGRIRQSARAAMESGFVERSFDRLVHQDRQYAYEAFVLLSLLIKAGEFEQIFATLKNHKNMKVRLAILHLLKVTKNQNAMDELYKLLEDQKLPEPIRAEVDRTIEEIGLVAV